MYQVLARKYRPRNFHELVGQTHVSRALTSALERGRLHHAYLFTGTRGVGKTTIARILAKCLNCETGITATPCEVCATCRAVNEGRFIDLIEIDAASRTKVEDTRELLDNVPYAPTQGRFKVYLIDEVHMLSTHSFNALLKTLEEPPEHVKFLFATTDPQKLPITVISRCLQFTLRPLDIDEIQQHLVTLLAREHIQAHQDALWQIAEAAQGSLRDALSLTDQAIAYGQGQIQAHDVKEMLGLLDRNMIYDLLLSIHANQQQQVSQLLLQMRQQALDVSLVLDQLIACLHELAMLQHLPELALQHSADIQAKLKQLSQHIHAQDLQLYYQIACKGRADLVMAVTQQQGFEMCVLRLLAFKPLPHELTLAALNTSDAQSSAIQPAQIQPEANATQPSLATFAIQPQYSQSTMAVQSEQKPYQVAVPIMPVAHSTAASQFHDTHTPHGAAVESAMEDVHDSVNGGVNGGVNDAVENVLLVDVMSKRINHVIKDAQTEHAQTQDTKHEAFSDEKRSAAISSHVPSKNTEMALDFAEDHHVPHLSQHHSITTLPPEGLQFDLSELPRGSVANALQNDIVPHSMLDEANWLAFLPEQFMVSSASSNSPIHADVKTLSLQHSPNDMNTHLANHENTDDVNPDLYQQPVEVAVVAPSLGQALPVMEPSAATAKMFVSQSTEDIVHQNQPIANDLPQALLSQELSPQQLLQTPSQDLTGQWTLQKWDFWIRSSGISPALQELAQNAEMTGEIEGASLLRIAPEYKNMLNSLQSLLQDALSSTWPSQKLHIEYVAPVSATPISLQQQRKHAAFERAETLLQQHPTIAALLKQFDGRLQHIQLK